MHGPSGASLVGVYTAQGIANAGFYPGGRSYSAGYYNVDTKEFWMFGGEGYGSVAGSSGALRIFDLAFPFIS
jgi:hypothetical protein